MSEIHSHIESSEKKWLNLIFTFLKEKFEISPLPSHDHYHHLRVWQNARLILEQLTYKGGNPDYVFVESLLISCMFHDVGMINTMEKNHGKESKEICIEFFNTKDKPSDLLSILEAIERHDDKSYSGFGPLIHNSKINLITALNIADDLDAFGFIGVYRYTEIYLMRGIPFEDLGLKIIANLSGRFRHFISNCTGMDQVISTFIQKHHEIENFFRIYNLQIRKLESGEGESKSGPLAVVKQIYRFTLMDFKSIPEVCDHVLETEKDSFFREFFTSLKEQAGG